MLTGNTLLKGVEPGALTWSSICLPVQHSVMQGGGTVYLDMTGLSLGWPIPWYPACKGMALDTLRNRCGGYILQT